MRDRAGFFAGCADTLTAMCLYYVVAGVLITGPGEWGLHLFWLLLCAAACCFAFAGLMKKPRTTPVLAAVTAGLFVLVMAVFFAASSAAPRFGYVLLLAVGAGMSAGLPLYYCLNRPKVMRHLTHVDVLILALLGVLLVQDALSIDRATTGLMVFVLLLDAAGAVGLRMSDGGAPDGGSALRASMVALGGSAVLASAVGLLSAVFSRSGAVTGGLLHRLGSGLAWIGGEIEAFFARLSALFYHRESFEAVEPAGELPSMAGAELGAERLEMPVSTTALGVVFAVLAAAVVCVTVYLRKRSFAREAGSASPPPDDGVRRTGGTAGVLWQRLRAALRFRWTAFVNRDTPAGLLVRLERQGRRLRSPRGAGESMRAFLGRMDPSGGLEDLADALDLQYYGGSIGTLGRRRCRELGRYIRRDLRRARRAGSAGEERA